MSLPPKRRFLAWGLLLLAVLALIYFISPHRADYLRYFREPQVSIAFHQPLTLEDVPMIQSWMTFDYLNRVFGLPAHYLAAVLEITDADYPNLVIQHYVSDQGLDLQSFSARIQAVITDYLSSKP